MSKTQAKDTIAVLVAKFRDNLADYKRVNYNETLTRIDFINPFFEALGWDITNRQGLPAAFREVIHEDTLEIEGRKKAPDYSFRLPNGRVERKFFLEAKKPAVNLADGVTPAYQVRRYGWSANLPLSALTDFEEFAVYDCRMRYSAPSGLCRSDNYDQATQSSSPRADRDLGVLPVHPVCKRAKIDAWSSLRCKDRRQKHEVYL